MKETREEMDIGYEKRRAQEEDLQQTYILLHAEDGTRHISPLK